MLVNKISNQEVQVDNSNQENKMAIVQVVTREKLSD
jgi:hypothetical protein